MNMTPKMEEEVLAVLRQPMDDVVGWVCHARVRILILSIWIVIIIFTNFWTPFTITYFTFYFRFFI